MLELNDEDKPAEESDKAHRVELSKVDVLSLSVEFSEGVPVLAVVKKFQDTGLVVSGNSFQNGVVSMADTGTTLGATEIAMNSYGVVVEVTHDRLLDVLPLHTA